jgi:hypothetical protein
MKANVHAKVARSAVLVMAIISLSGCVTGETIGYARTCSHTTESGEVVIDYKGKPGLYALVPLTIPADIALLPVYVGGIIAVNTGLMSPP